MFSLNTILNLVFPVNCIVCKKNGQYICLQCLSSSKNAVRECADWIFPIYDYRHPPVKKAVWLLKYNRKRQIAKVFAEAIYEKITEELADKTTMENFINPILMPIPISHERRRERGFNQSELICAEIIKINTSRNKISLDYQKNILKKRSETEHQARLKDRTHRLKNLAGSFFAENEPALAGRNIILIDDVVTTGATLSEAKKILQKSGARKIYAFTLAH